MNTEKTTISRAARLAGVGIETIRYYQRRGLIEEPPKPLEGYRHYPEQTISQIRFIKRAQELGFTLREIESLLQLGEQQCSETRALAGAKLELVRRKIEDLVGIRKTLEHLIEHCETRREGEACPIIYSISRDPEPES